MFLAFIHGLILAIGLIIPLGVQNVFVFNQGLTHARWFSALPVVLTAAVCDNFLVLIAVLGVSVLVLKILWIKYVLSLAGVIFLLYMGYITWRSEPDTFGVSDDGSHWPLGRQILFTATVSIFNPHAIIDTIGVIGTSSLTYYEPSARMAFTASTMIVSWLWFLFLMTAGHLLGRLENINQIRSVVNRVSAAIMWLSAVMLVNGLL